MSASVARVAKKSALFIAATFSATAVATNWLMLVPSSLLISATAAFRDAGRRYGYVLVCLFIPRSSSMPAGATAQQSRTVPEAQGAFRTMQDGSPG